LLIQAQYERVIREKVEYYNDPSSDRIQKLRQNMDETSSVMAQNLDMILERGEKLEVLMAKTHEAMK
jgi:vesicle-associated membrane protein 7